MEAAYTRAWRAERVSEGLCGWCGRARNFFDWLCDECAYKHRTNQQNKALCRLTSTWTGLVGDRRETGPLWEAGEADVVFGQVRSLQLAEGESAVEERRVPQAIQSLSQGLARRAQGQRAKVRADDKGEGVPARKVQARQGGWNPAAEIAGLLLEECREDQGKNESMGASEQGEESGEQESISGGSQERVVGEANGAAVEESRESKSLQNGKRRSSETVAKGLQPAKGCRDFRQEKSAVGEDGPREEAGTREEVPMQKKDKGHGNGVLAVSRPTDETVTVAEWKDYVKELSTETLKSELARLLGFTAENLLRLAMVVNELESRGENLSGIRMGILPFLRLIALGKLLPEMVVMHAGSPASLKQIAAMPIEEQRKIASGAKCFEPKQLPKTSVYDRDDDADQDRSLGKTAKAVAKHANPRDLAEMAADFFMEADDYCTVLLCFFDIMSNRLQQREDSKEARAMFARERDCLLSEIASRLKMTPTR